MLGTSSISWGTITNKAVSVGQFTKSKRGVGEDVGIIVSDFVGEIARGVFVGAVDVGVAVGARVIVRVGALVLHPILSTVGELVGIFVA